MATRIQLRRGTAAAWAAANPVLADGELGVEKDTRFYKFGDGVTPWNNLTYGGLENLNTATVLEMTQQETPVAPDAGMLKLYAKSLAGRMLLRQIGPSGVATPLQPSLFQNNIVLYSPNTTTSISAIGCAVTSVGTLGHPTPTEQYGYMTSFTTAATGNATAGTGTSAAPYYRGSAPGSNGFFFCSRLALPDSSYNESGVSTGSRIFVGFTSGTMALSVSGDDPAGSHMGFQRCHTNAGRKDTNWQFMTDSGVPNLIDTGLPFLPEKIYDFYIFSAPQGNAVYWRIDNLTDGTSAEGSAVDNLPLPSSPHRAGFQLQSVDLIARNIRMQRVYIETDR